MIERRVSWLKDKAAQGSKVTNNSKYRQMISGFPHFIVINLGTIKITVFVRGRASMGRRIPKRRNYRSAVRPAGETYPVVEQKTAEIMPQVSKWNEKLQSDDH
jgi:hypothetical protein